MRCQCGFNGLASFRLYVEPGEYGETGVFVTDIEESHQELTMSALVSAKPTP